MKFRAAEFQLQMKPFFSTQTGSVKADHHRFLLERRVTGCYYLQTELNHDEGFISQTQLFSVQPVSSSTPSPNCLCARLADPPESREESLTSQSFSEFLRASPQPASCRYFLHFSSGTRASRMKVCSGVQLGQLSFISSVVLRFTALYCSELFQAHLFFRVVNLT